MKTKICVKCMLSRLISVFLVLAFFITTVVSFNTEVNATTEIQDGSVNSVYASVRASFYLDNEGFLWVWGEVRDDYLSEPFKTNTRLKKISATSGSYFVGIDFQNNLNHYFPLTQNGDFVGYFPMLIQENVKEVSNNGHEWGYIDINGALWMKGYNNYGQVGNGTKTEVDTYVKVLDNVRTFSAHHSETYAVTEDNKLYGWGYNMKGNLGLGHSDEVLTPQLITDNVKKVINDGYSTVALKTDGSLHVWGYNSFFYDYNDYENNVMFIEQPIKVDDSVIDMSLENSVLLFIKSDQSLWGLGRNNNFILKDDFTWSIVNNPIKITDDIQNISTNGHHALAVNNDGEILSWGGNHEGQLGNGRYSRYHTPLKIENNVQDIDANYYASLFIDDNNHLYVSGYDLLTAFETTQTPHPIKVMENVIKASAGYFLHLSMKSDNSLWGWGNYQDAPDGTYFRETPSKKYENVKEVYSGFYNYALLTTDNRLLMWGENSEGQLGLGDTNPRENATEVLSDVIKVALSSSNSFAIKSDGSLWGWGSNYTGELGLGNTDMYTSPVKIMEGVLDVDAFDSTIAVLKSDRTVWLLGNSYYEDNFEYSLYPRLIGEGAVSIAAGDRVIGMIKDDDSLWTIGSNDYGQLGTKDFMDRVTFTKVMDGVKKVDFGAHHVMAIKNDNSLWTWGDNSYGQLANKVEDVVRRPTSIGSFGEQNLAISMSQLPTKRHYLLGETINVLGGFILVQSSSGSMNIIPLTSSMLSGYNPHSSTFGPQTVTVTYQGLTTSFEVYLDRFTDVPYGHQTYARINDLAEKGIINGYRDGTFKPTNFITRAQAAVMIVRALGLDYRGKTSNFADVPPTHASYEFISAAYEAGIISGYSVDGTFRPTQNITRAQIAVMIQRAFSIQHSGTEVGFSDVPDGYAPQRFIEALASQKIINGYSDGTFRPTNNTTRAQFSSMIYNAMRYNGN